MVRPAAEILSSELLCPLDFYRRTPRTAGLLTSRPSPVLVIGWPMDFAIARDSWHSQESHSWNPQLLALPGVSSLGSWYSQEPLPPLPLRALALRCFPILFSLLDSFPWSRSKGSPGCFLLLPLYFGSIAPGAAPKDLPGRFLMSRFIFRSRLPVGPLLRIPTEALLPLYSFLGSCAPPGCGVESYAYPTGRD